MDVYNRETLMLKNLKISHIQASKFRTSGFLVGKPFCVCFDQLKTIDFTSRNDICKNTSCDAKSHDFKQIGQPFEWHKMLQISDIHVMKWKNKDNVAQDISSNFTENSNGARHISIIVDSQPCIKSINKHKSHPVPPPRQQNVNEEYQDNSMIGCSIRVDPDMTLRDLLGAVTRGNQKPKVINEVSSEAALRNALEGEGDDEGSVELQLTLNGTSVSLEPAKSCKNNVDAPICLKKFLPGSTFHLANTSEKGHLSKTAKATKTVPTTIRKKQSVQCKPILKKSSNPIHNTSIKNFQTSKNSSLSSLSCYSSEFSLESEPALSKGYPKYLVLSRRARGKTDSPLSTDNSQLSGKKFPENRSGSKTATIERNTDCDIKNLLPALTQGATYSQLYQLKKLLDHQRQQEQEEIHKFYPVKKNSHKQSEAKRSTGKGVIKLGLETQQAFSCLSPSIPNPTKFQTTNMWSSGSISDKSLTSMESSSNSCGENKSVEAIKSQREKSDHSRTKRPAPPPPPNVSSHGLTKTVSVPSQQCKEKPSQDTAKQFSWEYFESNAFKRPAPPPPPPPPRKPFVSDLLSGERLGGRLYSSKGLVILRSSTEAHPLSDIPLTFSGSNRFEEDPATIESSKAEVYSVKKKRLAPLPPPRLTNIDVGSQMCSTLQSPTNDNRKDKPRVSFADGEGILDEQWRQAMQDFNLSYHYKEQSNNSASKEKFESSLDNKPCQTHPHMNTTSESCALLSDAQTHGKLPESLSYIATDNHPSSSITSNQSSGQSNNAERKLDGMKNFYSKNDKSAGDKKKPTEFSERLVNSTRTNMTFEEYIIQTKSPKAKLRLNIHNTCVPNSSLIAPMNHPSDYSQTQNTTSPTKGTPVPKYTDQNKSRNEFENKGPSPRFRHHEFKLAALKPCRPITNLLPLTKQDDSKNCETYNRSQNNAKIDPKAGTLCKDIRMQDKRKLDSPTKQVQFSQEVTAFVKDTQQGSDYSFQSVVGRRDHHPDSHSRFVSVDDDRSPGVELSKLLEESHSHEINSRFTSLSPSLSTSIIARAIGSSLNVSESMAQSREAMSIRNEISRRIGDQKHYASNSEQSGNPEYFFGRLQKEINNHELANPRSFESETSVIQSCSEPYRSESSSTLATSVDSEIDQIPFIEVLKPEKPNRFSYVRDLDEARFNQLRDFMPLDVVDEKHKLADLSNLMKTKQAELQGKFTDASKPSKVSNHKSEERNQRFSSKIQSKSRDLFSNDLSKLHIDSHRGILVNSRFSSADVGTRDWLSSNYNNNREEQSASIAQYDITSNLQHEVARERDEQNSVQNLTTDNTIELNNSRLMNNQKCDETEETITVFIDPRLDYHLSDHESDYSQRSSFSSVSGTFKDRNTSVEETTDDQEGVSRKSEIISSFRNELCNYESIQSKNEDLSLNGPHYAFSENTSDVKSAGELAANTSRHDENWKITPSNLKTLLTYHDNNKVLNQKDDSEIRALYGNTIGDNAHAENQSNSNKVVMSLVCEPVDNSNSFKLKPGIYNEPSFSSDNNLHLTKNQCLEKSEVCEGKESTLTQRKKVENVDIETVIENPAQLSLNSVRPASTMTRLLQTLSKRYPKAISRYKIGTTINFRNDTDALNKRMATDTHKSSKSSLFQGHSSNKHQSTSECSTKTGAIKPVKKSCKQTLNIFADQSVLFSRFKSKHGARKHLATRRSPAFLQKDTYSPDISRFSPPPSEHSSQSETFQSPESQPQMRFSELVLSDPLKLTPPEVLKIDGDLRSNGENRLDNELVTLPTSSSSFHENRSISCSAINRPTTPPRKSDIVLSVSYNRSDLENHRNFLNRHEKTNRCFSNVKLTSKSDEIVLPSDEVAPQNESPKVENNIAILSKKVWKNLHESFGVPANSTKVDLFNGPEIERRFTPETRDSLKHLRKISIKNQSHIQKDAEETKKVNKECHSFSSSSTRASETLFTDSSNLANRALPNVAFNPSNLPLTENKSEFINIMPSLEPNYEEKNVDINEPRDPNLVVASNLSETTGVGLTRPDHELGFRLDVETSRGRDKLNFKQISKDETFEGYVELPPSQMISSETFRNDLNACHVTGSNIVNSSNVFDERSSGVTLRHEFKRDQSNNLTQKSHIVGAEFCRNDGNGIIGNKNKQVSPDKCEVVDCDVPFFAGTNLLIRKYDFHEGMLMNKCHVKRDDDLSPVKLKSGVGAEVENGRRRVEDVVNVLSNNNSSEDALLSTNGSLSSCDEIKTNIDPNKSIGTSSTLDKYDTNDKSDHDQKHLSSLFSECDFVNTNCDHVTPQDLLENRHVSLSTLSTNSTFSSDSSGSFVVSRQNTNQKRVPGKFLVRNSIEGGNTLNNSGAKDSMSSDKIKPITVGRFDRRSYLPDGSCVSLLSNKENFHDENHFQDSSKWEFGGVAKTLEDLYMSPLKMPFKLDSTG